MSSGTARATSQKRGMFGARQQLLWNLFRLRMGPVSVYQVLRKVDIFQNLTQYLRVVVQGSICGLKPSLHTYLSPLSFSEEGIVPEQWLTRRVPRVVHHLF